MWRVVNPSSSTAQVRKASEPGVARGGRTQNYMGVILGFRGLVFWGNILLCRDNGKENGSYYNEWYVDGSKLLHDEAFVIMLVCRD